MVNRLRSSVGNTQIMKYVKFKPWVGCNYATGGIFGKKVLVLGESHYCDKPNAGADSNDTLDVIDEFINDYRGEHYQQTFLCFERAVMGKELSSEERFDFWNSIVFYNYIQQYQEGPRQALLPQKEDNEGAFKEVLETYLPDCIIVWGKRLYQELPGWDGYENYIEIDTFEYDHKSHQIDSTEVWTYNIKGKQIPAMCVYHPSSPVGKMWTYWHLFHKKFLCL